MCMRAEGRSKKAHAHVDTVYYVPKALESSCREESIRTPGSSSKGKGVRTEILLLYLEVAELATGHPVCKRLWTVDCTVVRQTWDTNSTSAPHDAVHI